MTQGPVDRNRTVSCEVVQVWSITVCHLNVILNVPFSKSTIASDILQTHVRWFLFYTFTCLGNWSKDQSLRDTGQGNGVLCSHCCLRHLLGGASSGVHMALERPTELSEVCLRTPRLEFLVSLLISPNLSMQNALRTT
eukprot:670530-Amphidinium_carterae.1